MKRTVRREYIDDWVAQNGPDGLAKLALRAGVSSSLLSKTRLGKVPAREYMRRSIAEAIGLNESELFPLAATRGRAS